ncbi:MAG: DUF4342 domain-containing protein [Gemmatimonadota bacterium]
MDLHTNPGSNHDLCRRHEHPRGGGPRDPRRRHPTGAARDHGGSTAETVKRIVREGNARRITIRNQDEEVILTFPLSAGVVGAALLPVWAGVGAMAALLGNCSIEVERRPDAPAPEDEPGL